MRYWVCHVLVVLIVMIIGSIEINYCVWFRYDLEFKQEFWFEKSQHTEYLAKLPLRFVWGVLAEDNGNYLEPGSKGSLVLDPTFRMASPESQVQIKFIAAIEIWSE